MTADLLRRVQDAEGASGYLNSEVARHAGLHIGDPLFDIAVAIWLVRRDFPDAVVELVEERHGCLARIVLPTDTVSDVRLDRYLPLAIIAAWLKAKEAVAREQETTP